MFSRGLVIIVFSLMATSSGTDGDPEELRSRIAAEIDRLGPHDWAGIYEIDPFLRLDIAPRSGYVLETRVGCLLMPVITYGDVIVGNGRLRLKRRVPTAVGEEDMLGSELLTLALGGRPYLVPPTQVTEFCNAVNGGYEPSSNALILPRRGEEAPADARPSVFPPEVSRCLLEKPVRGRIVSVGKVQGYGPGETTPGSTRKLRTGSGPLPVVLDVGARDGVWVGMEFHTVCPPCSWLPAVVSSVGERTSEAVYLAEWLADTPKPGWIVSTRLGDSLE